MTPQELEQSLKKGVVPRICFLYGEEQFLVEKVLQSILKIAVDSSLKDFNFNVYYGNEVKGTEVVDAAQTLPMFSDRRVVLVKRADQLKAEVLDTILPYILKPSDGTCLLFTASKIDQRKKFFLELKKHAAIVEYKRIYDNKLNSFIQSEAVANGAVMEAAAAELLAALTGNNLQELSSQIEKLLIYSGPNRRISVDDVRTMASNSKAFTAFEFAKFLGNRDLAGSLRSLDAMFLNGEETPMIIGALARHFRQLWRVRELLDCRMPQADIGRELKINPFFLAETVVQSRNFNRDELKHIFDEFYRSDIASKTGGQPYTLLHGLAVGICSDVW